jgi:hypothetical protein
MPLQRREGHQLGTAGALLGRRRSGRFSRTSNPISFGALLCSGHDAQNEVRFANRVRQAVIGVRTCQPPLQCFVFSRDIWMANQVVSKHKPVPMLLERRPPCHHMNMVRPDAALVALDKKCVPGRSILAKRGTPEVIIALRLQNGGDLGSGCSKTGHLDEYVNDWLGGETGDRCAAEVFDASDELRPQTTAQVLGLLPEQFGPARIVRHNTHVLPQSPRHSLFNRAL